MGITRDAVETDGLFEALWCPFCGSEDFVEEYPDGIYCARCYVEVQGVVRDTNDRHATVYFNTEARAGLLDGEERREINDKYPILPFGGTGYRVDVVAKVGTEGEGLERFVGFPTTTEREWLPKRGDDHNERLRAWHRRRERVEKERAEAVEERRKKMRERDERTENSEA